MRNFVRYSCLLALAATASLAQVVPTTITRTTGMVGIADGQTARLNLLNPGVVITPATGPACTAAVAFYDGAGNRLKSASLTIPAGQSASFDLRSDIDLSLEVGDRREIRAVITVPSAPPATSTGAVPVPVCGLVHTLEIFDSMTLRTVVVLSHTAVVP